ncbi:hypothetical protein [Oceanimonas baumannii]|uniref:Uncharacterized protein n=1 Tax=Oceanimonas baumannii TaxID=129578 RepID=A0A235CLV0_9GAMM|nr:hypothetical protein [Oceanimonas baumannii]OYD25568.1 hypothetical protein B6S09_04985 [Oceanimonas baumannii]TDW61224.1 hypothetical protein LY04_00756 [Oceanimonas baumannii]
MTPFAEYCQRHGLNPATTEARDQYRAYQRQLELFRSAAGLGTNDEPPAHSFPYALGEVTVCRVDDNRFTVRDQRLGLFAVCEREHVTVERWPASHELGQPAGAHFVLSAPGGLRVVLCELIPDDAPRLAWFVGVELVEGAE